LGLPFIALKEPFMSTQDNLQTAFAGESQANRKYTAYAKKAEQDKKPQIARIFRAAAYAETVHALNHFRAMGKVKSTVENLKDGMEGESYEFTSMYPPFLEDAKKENVPAAINAFRFALEAERGHYDLYKKALEAAEKGQDLPGKKMWVCEVCGHTFEGDEAPEKCPICGANHKAYTEVL
jgi:rubrerythrin